jgi:hypothetical protein
MKTEDMIIIGGALAAVLLLTKGRAGSYVGETVGYAAGGAVGGTASGIAKGLIDTVLIKPYNWAQTYQGHIPIIDPLAKKAAWIKRLGNNERWFW